MKVCKSAITDYLSINVAETEPEWTSGALFNYADEIRSGHFIYKYAGVDQTNTTDSPEVTYEQHKDAYSVWVRIRPTNYWAALDERGDTKTENADSLIIELDNRRCDTFAALGLECAAVTIELIDKTTSEVYYANAFNLLDRSARIDAYSHYFSPIELRTNIYDDSIPLLPNTKLKITIESQGGIAKVGRLVFGQSYYVGKTLYPATLDYQSYSRFNTDVFGNTELKQIASLPVETYLIRTEASKIPSLKQKRKEMDAVPILFIMDESPDSILENLLIFGYFSSAPIVAQNGTVADINVNIKGVK